jgi:hypothetical protein
MADIHDGVMGGSWVQTFDGRSRAAMAMPNLRGIVCHGVLSVTLYGLYQLFPHECWHGTNCRIQ